MINRWTALLVLGALVIFVFCSLSARADEVKAEAAQVTVSLPAPALTGEVTVEKALQGRRSVRSYAPEPVTLRQVSQLLWAAQGITEPTQGLRTAPSAQRTYPLRVYLFAGSVTDLPAGVYLYVPLGHKLELVMSGDQRTSVGGQPQMTNAPAMFCYVADYSVTGKKYGERAREFAAIEVGHSAQNVLLEEVALGLVGVPMGGFDAAKMKALLKLADNQEPMYAVSAGRKAAAGSGTAR
jgi:SagB-type dehydrogenase family enzyme